MAMRRSPLNKDNERRDGSARVLWWAAAGLGLLAAVAAALRARRGTRTHLATDEHAVGPDSASPDLPALESRMVEQSSRAQPAAQNLHHQAEGGSGQYENSDVRFLPIFAVVMLLAITLATVAGTARWFFWRQYARDANGGPLAAPSRQALKLPAEPRLETLEPEPGSARSFAVEQQDTELVLHRYGPTNEPGFVHVPIEQAMHELAATLHVHEPSPQSDPKSLGLVGGGDANSGRALQGTSP